MDWTILIVMAVVAIVFTEAPQKSKRVKNNEDGPSPSER